MSLKSRRICKCCGKEYEYCPHCGSHSDEMWRNLTDTNECLAVFNIVAAYNVGRATADQVKRVLEENNITDYSTFKEGIVSTLNKIFKPAESLSVNQSIKTTEEPIVLEAPEPQVNVMTKELEIKAPAASSIEVQSTSRKTRGKKKHRTRNADIEL